MCYFSLQVEQMILCLLFILASEELNYNLWRVKKQTSWVMENIIQS